MKTAEIINQVCTYLGIAKSDLAKRMGLYPSSLYRKLAKESMTLEELQKCLSAMGVSMEISFHYPDGKVHSSQENHEQLVDKLELMEKELAVAGRASEFHKKTLRELRTQLNSAVGYTELGGRHSSQAESYLEKIQMVHSNMEKTISCALGEAIDDDAHEAGNEEIEALEGKRVLLADDNELNREILREMLLDYGLLVEEAEDGNQAVSMVKEREAGYYQFVLMDIEMPKMDGYEATIKIRQLPNRIRANIPIIALTANAVGENRERASAVGMDDFLVKPANSARLLRSLVKFL